MVDLGNTRAKWAVFTGALLPAGQGIAALPQPVATGVWSYSAPPELPQPLPTHWAAVNVQHADHPLLATLAAALGSPPLQLSAATPSALRMAYETPHTLGADRYLAAVAAHHALQPAPVLSIDLGTAITYDAVDASAAYLGGAIAPGLRMRYRALHSYTSRLPVLEPSPDAPLPPPVGRSTEGSLRAGVELALVAEAEGMIARYRQVLGAALAVVITGGDGPWLHRHLSAGLENPAESRTFAAPYLVLQGAHVLARSLRLGLSNA